MFCSKLDRRSESERRDDQRFLQALKAIPTLQARNGHLSMSASDLQDEVEKMAEVAKRMVDDHR